jgi:hypothetical protein
MMSGSRAAMVLLNWIAPAPRPLFDLAPRRPEIPIWSRFRLRFG